MHQGSTAVEEKDFWNTAEFGEWIGRSVYTLQRWRSENSGPPWIKNHGRVVYEREKVIEWLRSLEVDPAEFEENETLPEKSDDGYRRYSTREGRFVKGGAS